ncbi:Protein kinase domain-containing protein [Collimonas sp. OK607]|nr:Protein kinase domain-containing protein [Collimonas sp. OK607]
MHENKFLHRDIKPSNIYVTEQNIAVIGDFGSVKKLPDGRSSIPASSHSLLYRPPETVTHNCYGISGDIYQTGVVLFQLLGGYLPYESRAWLTRSDLKKLDSMSNETDQNAFVDQCVKTKIANGKILNFASLPPWVPDNLKRIVKRACLVDDTKRYSSASAFMAKLHECRPKTLDWRIEDGHPILLGTPSYKIVSQGGFRVQKRHDGEWRNDNSFSGKNLAELVVEISNKVQT